MKWLFEPVDTISTDANRCLSLNQSLTCKNQVFLLDDLITYFGCCHFTTFAPGLNRASSEMITPKRNEEVIK